MLDAIKRIVRGECQASGSPREPEFETVASFPLLDNDTAATDQVAAAFTAHFGKNAHDLPKQTVSEDFGLIPAAAGAHSPQFLPPLQPTLRTGTEAMVTAAMAWLARP